MPRIHFLRLARASIEVEKGANLMRSLLSEGIPVASSCNGDGVCGKCKMMVAGDPSHTNPPNETEIILKEKFQLPSSMRMSCQVAVLGDISVDATYW